MKTDDVWQPFTLEFKQGYDGAYEYLDRCGKFVSLLREQFGFYSTEILPTGCRLELPDRRIIVSANANELSVAQEGKADDKFFLEIAEAASTAAIDLFNPFEVFRNHFIGRTVRLQNTLEKANLYSLVFWGNEYEGIARLLSLQPNSKDVKMTFKSGSYELDVQSQSVALSVSGRTQNVPSNRAPKGQSDYINKVREAINRPIFNPGYGVLLSLDLSEASPAANNLAEHLRLLRGYIDVILKNTAL